MGVLPKPTLVYTTAFYRYLYIPQDTIGTISYKIISERVMLPVSTLFPIRRVLKREVYLLFDIQEIYNGSGSISPVGAPTDIFSPFSPRGNSDQ
ncbi:hypothetical protein TNIN_195451 [Trichonephila inaurata madagascariensis]|uniref:Uncharacterized protein n=1 Tax=Trichonephila inaurata madagascariensis TaxID=2747483 RepID=A0A8X6IPH4_9ARAC|nr:hypothetical protein TNIN_195451 [Trichonephila inaurata madagascariensis]